jgi:thymidylate kinase
VADPRLRAALTPRVAALLGAADAQARIGVPIARRLAAGQIVLADRYAWTALAREVARGLELDWVSNLHRLLPAPAVVLFHRAEPRFAVDRALADRPPSIRSAAVESAFGEFVARLAATYEVLVGRAHSGDPAPWPTELVVLERGRHEEGVRAARNAVLELVEARGLGLAGGR